MGSSGVSQRAEPPYPLQLHAGSDLQPRKNEFLMTFVNYSGQYQIQLLLSQELNLMTFQCVNLGQKKREKKCNRNQ